MRDRFLLPMMAALFWLGLSNIFLRSSMGVLAPELARELSLTPAMPGAIASGFFLAYALLQIPAGMLLDRFGPRRTLIGLFLITVAGTVLFALAPSAPVMLAARMLMGLGCAGVFAGAFMLILRFYPANRFTTIGGTLNSFAMLGTLLATVPLAYLITWIGWRASFLWIAGATGLVALVAILTLRDWPGDSTTDGDTKPEPGPAAAQENLLQILAGVKQAIRIKGVLYVASGGIALSAGNIFLGIWGGPYLNDVYGLDETGRGEVLIFMAIAGVFGHLIYGKAAQWLDSLKAPVLFGASGIFVIMSIFALLPDPALMTVTVLFALLGMVCGFPTIMLAHARAYMPDHLIGRGITVVNTGVMISIAIMQIAVGWVIGALTPVGQIGAPADGYRAAFAFIASMALITLFFYSKTENHKPSELGGQAPASK